MCIHSGKSLYKLGNNHLVEFFSKVNDLEKEKKWISWYNIIKNIAHLSYLFTSHVYVNVNFHKVEV